MYEKHSCLVSGTYQHVLVRTVKEFLYLHVLVRTGTYRHDTGTYEYRISAIVRTSTYKYPTRKVCTFSLKYVLYHAFCTQYVLSTYCFRKVRTWYAQGEIVRTWNVLGVKSTYQYRAVQGGTVL